MVREESSSHSTRFPSTQSTNFFETSLVADAYGSRAYEAYEEEQFQNLLNFSAGGRRYSSAEREVFPFPMDLHTPIYFDLLRINEKPTTPEPLYLS